MAERADTRIDPRWVVPVEPHGAVLENHSLVIHRGKIAALLPNEEARQRYDADEVVTLPDHALVPGLVNAHTHGAMSLLRGYADELPLDTWLKDYIWPAEGRWVSPEFVSDGTELALAELLAGGVTCLNDMYFFPDASVGAATRMGMRISAGIIVIDFPSAWAENGRDYLNKGLAVRDEYKGHPLVSFTLAPHAPYSVATDLLRQVRMYSDELDLPIHMHVHETAAEVQNGIDAWQRRPLAYLDEEGLLGPNLLAVHMTQLQPEEIGRAAEAGVNVVHCPESNLKLASGFCPVADLMTAGVNIALGTDGAASNNDLDMWGEMKTAALLAKGIAGRADAAPAANVLRMATLNGARAIGLDGEIGSLEAGKSADIAAVDLGALDKQPVYDVISQLIYSGGRERVTDVWIAGERKVDNRELVGIDAGTIREKAVQWGRKIAGEGALEV
ncbi:MAG TPA: TRZ/ATZ family hydrolase [Gammaproteobacteria bacterium]|nr:TRZ/ATZ family hydrolase [Gammaproteobacteria bacterium]